MSFAAASARARRDVDASLAALLEDAEPALRDALAPALAGGQRLRPALLLLVHDALGGAQTADALRYATCVELVHTATLIHDDIVDGDDERRGRPATRALLRGAAPHSSDALAALVGDAALAWGLTLLREPPALDLAARAIRTAWSGAWHEARGTLDAAEVGRRKTGSLFRLACELGALAARASPDPMARAGAYGAHVGLAYQCADDLRDEEGGARHLAAMADEEVARARALALRFPPGPHRAALVEAPSAIVARAWPKLEGLA